MSSDNQQSQQQLKPSTSTTSSLNSSLVKNQILFDDYEGSEFEFNTKNDNLSAKNQRASSTLNEEENLTRANRNHHVDQVKTAKSKLYEEQNRFEQKIRNYHYMSMNAYDKHKKLVNDYIRYYSGASNKKLSEIFKRDTSRDKTDMDVIREQNKFIWDDNDSVDSWEKRLAKRYYDKLFKEYCICDLSLYEQNKIALRWRIEKEVIDGKGQFVCGNKKCQLKDFLKTWEVNFGYVEDNEKKNALVKLRLCPDCSFKLNFHHQRREVTKPVKSIEDSKRKKTKKEKKKKTKKKIKSSPLSSQSKETTSASPSSSSSSSSSNEDESAKESQTETVKTKADGEKLQDNMIILEGDDSIWKNKATSVIDQDDLKSTEEQIENYLEDLFF